MGLRLRIDQLDWQKLQYLTILFPARHASELSTYSASMRLRHPLKHEINKEGNQRGVKHDMSNDIVKENLRRLLLLHDSSDKAITRREIKRILNYHNDRQLRLLIHDLRHDPVNGLPVLFNTGSPAGYYVPSTRADLEKRTTWLPHKDFSGKKEYFHSVVPSSRQKARMSRLGKILS